MPAWKFIIARIPGARPKTAGGDCGVGVGVGLGDAVGDGDGVGVGVGVAVGLGDGTTVGETGILLAPVAKFAEILASLIAVGVSI